MKNLSPRWRKLIGDARTARGRFIGIGVAMTTTIAIVATILSARVVLNREMNRNYLDTIPPSATLSLAAVDEDLLKSVRAQPGIVDAERSTAISVKTQLPSGESITMILRVVPDFSALHIAKFYPQSGAWPPATGEVLIERAVDRMMPIKVGADVDIELASGDKHTLRIAGTVHDPGEAPAWQERLIYAYVTDDTLKQLDPTQRFDQLDVVSEARTTPEIESTMRRLATWLRDSGHPVSFVRIPPPGKHPHQWQIDSVALSLLGFGLLAIVLEATLLAIVIGGLLAPQVRQIAVMKAIGARTSQIVGMYSTLVLVLASAALIVGLPVGLLAGHWFAGFIADLLNFNIANDTVPSSIYCICISLGLVVPMLAAMGPVMSAARKSVRESIDYYGVSSAARNGWLHRLFSRVRVDNAAMQLALRNLSRRKSQIRMALSLLALTGAVFMIAGNLLGLWRTLTNISIADQRFDIQVNLRNAEPEAAVTDAIRSVPGVRAVEPARLIWTNVDDGDGISFSTRSLPLIAVVPGSELQRVDVMTGRWLLPSDGDAVVLNSAAVANLFPRANVGDTISLVVNGRMMRLKVVGIAREMFYSARAFTTASGFAEVADSQSVRTLIVGLNAGADADVAANAIETALAARNLPVRRTFTKSSSSAGITAHTYIFISMFLLLITSIGKIAIAGLASCMSTAVIERTREFGVMRTLGARSYDIQNSIIFEAVLIGIASWLIAVAISIPLTLWIGTLLSDVVKRPLPIVFSPTVAVLWLVGAAFVAMIASVAPARRAAGLAIRQTLDHS